MSTGTERNHHDLSSFESSKSDRHLVRSYTLITQTYRDILKLYTDRTNL